MSSNLPPGCSSPDGGIDHGMESALDALCNAVETPEEAAYLRMLLPSIREIIRGEYQHGLSAGRNEE